MQKLSPIPAETQATLSTSITENIATVTFSVKPNGEKDSARYNLTQTFDFVDVSNDEILTLATRSLRIDVQSVWRKDSDRMNAEKWADRKWSVRAMLDQTRTKTDPKTKVLNAIGKMSKDEKDAILELLKKM